MPDPSVRAIDGEVLVVGLAAGAIAVRTQLHRWRVTRARHADRGPARILR